MDLRKLAIMVMIAVFSGAGAALLTWALVSR